MPLVDPVIWTARPLAREQIYVVRRNRGQPAAPHLVLNWVCFAKLPQSGLRLFSALLVHVVFCRPIFARHYGQMKLHRKLLARESHSEPAPFWPPRFTSTSTAAGGATGSPARLACRRCNSWRVFIKERLRACSRRSSIMNCRLCSSTTFMA